MGFRLSLDGLFLKEGRSFPHLKMPFHETLKVVATRLQGFPLARSLTNHGLGGLESLALSADHQTDFFFRWWIQLSLLADLQM